MSRELEFTYGDMRQETLEQDLGDLSTIRSLDISGNNINAEGCVELSDRFIAGMANLESLDIKDNNLGPVGATRLFEVLLKHCPKLTYLDVNENAIQDEAMYPLALLLQGGRLQTLYAVTNHITPRGLPTLCDGVVASSTLRELSLAFNVLGDEGATIVAEMLAGHRTLASLNLSDNGIADAGAVALAFGFILGRNSKMAELDLSVNRIGDIGFLAVGEALTARGSNPHLNHLDLGCNDAVTDVGRAGFVGYAAGMRHIYSLDLTSCNLSDENALVLAKAISNPKVSLGTVEWFNNPRMTLPAEKELYDTIQAKAAALEAAGCARGSRRFTVANVTAAVIGIATVVLAVTRRRRIA